MVEVFLTLSNHRSHLYPLYQIILHGKKDYMKSAIHSLSRLTHTILPRFIRWHYSMILSCWFSCLPHMQRAVVAQLVSAWMIYCSLVLCQNLEILGLNLIRGEICHLTLSNCQCLESPENMHTINAE